MNRAGETFSGWWAGAPVDALRPEWRLTVRTTLGALTKEVRKPFAKLVKEHAKENGWRVTRIDYAPGFVVLFVVPLFITVSSAASSLSKKL